MARRFFADIHRNACRKNPHMVYDGYSFFEVSQLAEIPAETGDRIFIDSYPINLTDELLGLLRKGVELYALRRPQTFGEVRRQEKVYCETCDVIRHAIVSDDGRKCVLGHWGVIVFGVKLPKYKQRQLGIDEGQVDAWLLSKMPESWFKPLTEGFLVLRERISVYGLLLRWRVRALQRASSYDKGDVERVF